MTFPINFPINIPSNDSRHALFFIWVGAAIGAVNLLVQIVFLDKMYIANMFLYGFAIALEQPDGSTSTYHFAVDTAPPRGGRAVDNFGENWSIAKQASPYSLDFNQSGSSRRIACKA